MEQAPNEVAGSGTSVGENAPKFGSVTRSTNADAESVTTDSASAGYAGGKLVITIDRSRKQDLVLESGDVFATARTGNNGLQGYTIESCGVRSAAVEAHMFAARYVDSDDGFATRLSGGYRLHVAVDGAGAMVEAGAFVGVPEIGSPGAVPQGGTAVYTASVAPFAAATASAFPRKRSLRAMTIRAWRPEPSGRRILRGLGSYATNPI